MNDQNFEICPICDGEGVFMHEGYEGHKYVADCDCIGGKIYHDDDNDE